ncbi:BnaA08g03600D [Brassica napus]|uniref:BnaA08g03600D protein n=1 Tax=Brassica napus TaxID=3708 RepID=A0A078FVM0_BRANA|nr:BnaA08g03600D [Brassica napus]
MDRRSWPWKKKSSDKTTLVVESAADTSHPQVEKKPKYVQISVEQYTHLTSLEEQIKTYDTLNEEKEDLSEKLTAANEEIDTKEALL